MHLTYSPQSHASHRHAQMHNRAFGAVLYFVLFLKPRLRRGSLFCFVS